MGAFPTEERYGLTGQLRRAATSIPINIAEGCGRDGDVDFARFLQIAAGSASEVEYELLLAHDLGYLADEVYTDLDAQTRRAKQMLYRFIEHLRRGPSPET